MVENLTSFEVKNPPIEKRFISMGSAFPSPKVHHSTELQFRQFGIEGLDKSLLACGYVRGAKPVIQGCLGLTFVRLAFSSNAQNPEFLYFVQSPPQRCVTPLAQALNLPHPRSCSPATARKGFAWLDQV